MPLISGGRCRCSLLADAGELLPGAGRLNGGPATPRCDRPSVSHASVFASVNARLYRAFLAVVSTRADSYSITALFSPTRLFPTRLLMNFDARRPRFISCRYFYGPNCHCFRSVYCRHFLLRRFFMSRRSFNLSTQ